MKTLNLDWTKSWPAYVKHMAELYKAGATEREAGDIVAGTEIHWTGRIGAIRSSAYELARIQMNMERTAVDLSDGYTFEGGHISLAIDADSEMNKCARLKVGDTLRFRARLTPSKNVFSAVGFANDAEQRKVLLETSLENVVLDEAPL